MTKMEKTRAKPVILEVGWVVNGGSSVLDSRHLGSIYVEKSMGDVEP